MLRNTREDFPASPEAEQLLSSRAHGGTPDAHVRLQPEERWLTSDEAYLQSGISSSRSTLAGLNDVSRIGQVPSDNSDNVATRLPASVADDGDHRDDDPPPYTANPPPSHIGWPYGIFSLDHAYSGNDRAAASRAEVSLALFQGTPTASTGFHPGGSCSQHTSSFATPLTPYQFSKFGCRTNSVLLRETSFPDNEIAEKIDDTKSRRYGAILVAAAVIIFLMALSLMVRFIMEKSWWRA